MGSTPIGISASRGAAILGLSDYRTPVMAWLQIMEELHPGFCQVNGYTTPERQDSAPLRWGSAFEDAVIVEAQKAMRSLITDREGFYSVSAGPMDITCHIDGRYSAEILHEGKTTTDMAFRMKWGTPGTDRIPSDYQVQVQHQMKCTGSREVVVSVLVFPDSQDALELLGWRVVKLGSDAVGSSSDGTAQTVIRMLTPSHRRKWAAVLAELGFFHQYVIQSHEDVQNQMLDRYRGFWNDHVLTETPPPVSGYGDIQALFPSPVGTIIAPPEIAMWAGEYKDIGKEIGSSGNLAKRRDQLKVLILDWARQQKGFAIDDNSQEKVVIMDATGKRVASYDGKTFRT